MSDLVSSWPASPAVQGELEKPPEALTSNELVTSQNGPGWTCGVSQHCEHAEGARSTITDLTLVSLNPGNPNHDNMTDLCV